MCEHCQASGLQTITNRGVIIVVVLLLCFVGFGILAIFYYHIVFAVLSGLSFFLLYALLSVLSLMTHAREHPWRCSYWPYWLPCYYTWCCCFCESKDEVFGEYP